QTTSRAPSSSSPICEIHSMCSYQDGLEGRPRTMSIGLHGRLASRPGRTAGLIRFLDHGAQHDRVWVATRADIARHWRANFPPGKNLSQRW
ncbi:MAG: hypothetical protein QOF70_3726, partial [Acetobacteraceae bacterium]|nr:hypothetical protein [Acetobacteraceae bacterium]